MALIFPFRPALDELVVIVQNFVFNRISVRVKRNFHFLFERGSEVDVRSCVSCSVRLLMKVAGNGVIITGAMFFRVSDISDT